MAYELTNRFKIEEHGSDMTSIGLMTGMKGNGQLLTWMDSGEIQKIDISSGKVVGSLGGTLDHTQYIYLTDIKCDDDTIYLITPKHGLALDYDGIFKGFFEIFPYYDYRTDHFAIIKGNFACSKECGAEIFGMPGFLSLFSRRININEDGDVSRINDLRITDMETLDKRLYVLTDGYPDGMNRILSYNKHYEFKGEIELDCKDARSFALHDKQAFIPTRKSIDVYDLKSGNAVQTIKADKLRYPLNVAFVDDALVVYQDYKDICPELLIFRDI